MTTDGRYYTRGSSPADDLNAVKDDVEIHRNSAVTGIEYIDANLRELPETIEVLAFRKDRDGIRGIAACAKEANDAQEQFKRELSDLDTQRGRIDQYQPRKIKQIISQRDDYFKLGLKYMDLRDRTNAVGGPLGEKIMVTLDGPTSEKEEGMGQ